MLRGKQLANGKYEYEQPVTYWMPFNGGIGFHDANWSAILGGDRFMEGGSHGCINMPPEKAAELIILLTAIFQSYVSINIDQELLFCNLLIGGIEQFSEK